MTQSTVNHAIATAIADLVSAAMTEAKDGYEFEDTLERRYAAGNLDGMIHLAILLGFEVNSKDSDELTKIGRGYIENLPMHCKHKDYTETAREETEPAEDGLADWTVFECGNCETEIRRERFL